MIMRFRTILRGRKVTYKKINIELAGIVYNEAAKIQAIMDINESEKLRRLSEATELYDDFREFFVTSEKQKYLTSVLSKDSVEHMLSEIEEHFIEVEDFEKCAQIQKWRKQL